MEDEEKKTISNDTKTIAHPITKSSPTQSHSPAREAEPSSQIPRSPAESSVSSDLSDHTSLSHGSSPDHEKRPATTPENLPAKSPSPQPQPAVNRSVRDEPPAAIKVDRGIGDGVYAGVPEGGGGSSGGRVRQQLSILRRVKRETVIQKAALGIRIFGFVFCLISFSVMASDVNKGWAIDSFHRYKEFRYCMSVNVIGFMYSAAQALDLVRYLATGNHVNRNPVRYYFDFSMDQILTYLLMSASSSAGTRVEDWLSNWGKDKFPEMATASVGISFMAFVAFAASSLLSGYALCSFRSL
ncbi:hypothetical protein U1Q18_038373 [Sarracenia purpurea var. burkii]